MNLANCNTTRAENVLRSSLTKSAMYYFTISYLMIVASGSSQSVRSRQPDEEETSHGLLAFRERNRYLFY